MAFGARADAGELHRRAAIAVPAARVVSLAHRAGDDIRGLKPGRVRCRGPAVARQPPDVDAVERPAHDGAERDRAAVVGQARRGDRSVRDAHRAGVEPAAGAVRVVRRGGATLRRRRAAGLGGARAGAHRRSDRVCAPLPARGRAGRGREARRAGEGDRRGSRAAARADDARADARGVADIPDRRVPARRGYPARALPAPAAADARADGVAAHRRSDRARARASASRATATSRPRFAASSGLRRRGIARSPAAGRSAAGADLIPGGACRGGEPHERRSWAGAARPGRSGSAAHRFRRRLGRGRRPRRAGIESSRKRRAADGNSLVV